MEKEMYIDVKNYVREKSGLYYAVMVYKNIRGESKEKWVPTQLQVRETRQRLKIFFVKYFENSKYPVKTYAYTR